LRLQVAERVENPTTIIAHVHRTLGGCGDVTMACTSLVANFVDRTFPRPRTLRDTLALPAFLSCAVNARLRPSSLIEAT
jgi:hypothetical protein